MGADGAQTPPIALVSLVVVARPEFAVLVALPRDPYFAVVVVLPTDQPPGFPVMHEHLLP